MFFRWSDVGLAEKLKGGIVCALVLAQGLLFCRLLALHASTTLLVAFLYGLPLALACGLLVIRKSRLRYVDMTMAMFAAGGLGMFSGCLADMNGLGLYGLQGLLSLCRATAGLPLGLDTLWLKVQFTPWMYIGMFVGGNIGMLLFDILWFRRFPARANSFYDYIICNAGMLIGMLLGDGLSMLLTTGLNPLWASVAMLVFMLLGMTLGMITLLHLSARLKIYRWTSAINT